MKPISYRARFYGFGECTHFICINEMAECETPVKALKALKAGLGMTNEEMGALVGLSKAMVGYYLRKGNEEIPLIYLLAFCEALKISYTHTTPDGTTVRFMQD